MAMGVGGGGGLMWESVVYGGNSFCHTFPFKAAISTFLYILTAASWLYMEI